MIWYSKRGEHRLSFGYKFVGLPWKLLKLYPTIHSYLFYFFTMCWIGNYIHIYLNVVHWSVPLRYEWNFQKWGYSKRGEHRLHLDINLSASLENFWRTIHSYLFLFLHNELKSLCVHGGSLRYEWIGQIQKWYNILKGENIGFHLDINLSASLENFWSYIQPYIHIYFYFFTMYSVELFPLNES